MKKVDVIENAAKKLLDGNFEGASELIKEEYPFNKLEATGRKYTDKQKMEQFVRDEWITDWGFLY